jgi:hypothetical protein
VALQRLVGTRQLIKDRPQVPPGVGGGDEFTTIVYGAYHEATALALLRLDDAFRGSLSSPSEGLIAMMPIWHEHPQGGRSRRNPDGVAPSASAISRFNRELEQQFTAWCGLPLLAHWRILYLDGVNFSVRHRGQADSAVILKAL